MCENEGKVYKGNLVVKAVEVKTGGSITKLSNILYRFGVPYDDIFVQPLNDSDLYFDIEFDSESPFEDSNVTISDAEWLVIVGKRIFTMDADSFLTNFFIGGDS